MKIVIAGAGSIGCYCGGLLAEVGHEVALLGRARVLDPIRQHGLTVTDYSGQYRHISPKDLTLTEDAVCLQSAEIVIVTVKTGATAEMASLIAQNVADHAPILSWQNGMESSRILRRELPDHDVRAGMVPFNVVPVDPATYHRASSGEVMIQSGPGELSKWLGSELQQIIESNDIEAVQWGKLLINLNNALNALSGLTLREQLLSRQWRRLLADQMVEALTVLKASGIKAASTTPLPVWVTPYILRLPTPVFSRIAARMLTIDPTARTSMAYDFTASRSTEIDSLQGEVIRLGEKVGVSTPICQRVADLIKQGNCEPMNPDQVVRDDPVV
ncbi:2-dehydropantoate 2-reductase [Ruegeria arenilitoris]|uniref:2-dehydropantoate 2-reductase n=1 Tax=Ruegeria arenilitoris TaxID=1173585 RepID=UPI00147F9480|nr:2-dehydropantoate 2-reductase [Ruegeria arenilitoris]